MSSSAVAWKTWEGRTVDGKFPLRQWLGGSDHSVVFLTEWQGQKAAIKLTSSDGMDGDQQISRWQKAASLSHLHLIRIYDAGRWQLDNAALLYVVTECADEDLSQILPQRALTPAEVTDLLPPLLDAVAYLHSNGFVHGAIRPSNVLALGNQLKLSSDRIACAEDGSSGRKRRDVYDAPESAAGIIWPASDVWSLGVTLVATLMQGVKFSTEGSQGDPGLPPNMPEPFRGIAAECLHFDPKRRCSIADVAARLQPIGRSVPADSVAPAITEPAPRRTNRPMIGVAVIVVALLAGLILFYPHAKNGSAGPAGPAAPSSTRASQPSAAHEQPPAEKAPGAVREATSAPPSASPATPTPSPKAQPSISRKGNPARASGGIALHQVLPEVPRSARDTITGKIRVTVRVEVDPSGKVSRARITSEGPSRYFARLALKAAQGWEFSPPQLSGQPVASAWLLHYRFGRTRTEVSPERITH
jgi:TonB family protein